VVGSPQTVARQLADMSAAGVDGVALKCIDFDDTLERLQRQVLPILEDMGVRQPFIKKKAA
jgi:FMNH2-dependent dimethyl sulfone monooxygenase